MLPIYSLISLHMPEGEPQNKALENQPFELETEIKKDSPLYNTIAEFLKSHINKNTTYCITKNNVGISGFGDTSTYEISIEGWENKLMVKISNGNITFDAFSQILLNNRHSIQNINEAAEE